MEPHSPLAAWETFFFLIGSSAAALTGLQFVVIALIAESARRATPREIEAFSTPTIVHFAGVLLVAAIVSAPWYGLSRVAIILGLSGLAGIVYTLNIIRRTLRQTTYRAVMEDWLWHVILPLIAYVILFVSAIFLPGHAHRALFGIGATELLLVFIGLHNAWDTVTYITVSHPLGNKGTEAHATPETQVASLPPAETRMPDDKPAPARQKSGRKFRGRK